MLTAMAEPTAGGTAAAPSVPRREGAQEDPLPDHFGTYVLEAPVESRSAASLYRARDTRRNLLVVLQVLPTGCSSDPGLAERFRRTMPRVQRLDDRHLVPVHDFGEVHGRLYVARRLIYGRPLATVLAAAGTLSPHRTGHLLGQVAAALDAVHGAGLVHGEVNPWTVLVTLNDYCWLTDLGVPQPARTTATSLALPGAGSALGCMAPERLTGQRVDERADVYSLAGLLQACVTGSLPYGVDDLPSLLHAQIRGRSPLEGTAVPEPLAEVLRRGLALRPEDRYPTAGDLAAAAQEALLRPAPPSPPLTTPAVPGSRAEDAAPDGDDGFGGVDGPTDDGRPPGLPSARARSPFLRRGSLVAAAVGVLVAGIVTALLLGGRGEPGAGTRTAAAGGPGTGGPAAATPAAQAAAGHEHGSAGAAGPAASVDDPRPGAAVPIGGQPHDVAVTPDGTSAWVADPARGTVVVLDPATGATTATIPIPEGPPQMVTFSPDGSRAYVSVFDAAYRRNFLDFVDTRTRVILASVPVGKGPYGVGTTPDGRKLYVPLFADAHMDVLDTATAAVVGHVEEQPNPQWVAVSRDGRWAYTANHYSDVVTVVDTATDQVVRTIAVGDGPRSVELSPDGTRLAVADSLAGSVTLIDAASNQVVLTVSGLGAGPQDVTWAPDGRHVYTADVSDGTVGVVDTSSGTVTAQVPTGRGPSSVAVLPDGRHALVTNGDDGTLRFLDTAAR
jgi:YVTN family beta-propeller protein